MVHKPKSNPWISRPELIREFLDARPRYEELCREVEYILRKRMHEANIEISTVISRAKTLDSFLEKLERKAYDDPLSQVTDISGVRVVCLYLDDIPNVEKIISDEFNVVERVDKLAEKQPDEFGYGALHFVVKLGTKSRGARYDDLRSSLCEIQVRTVLQDAWAIVEYHLMYKSESAVPSVIQRKLNSLAGLFETADDQFRQIRKERIEYVEAVRGTTDKPDQFLANELNLDSYREYLQWRFKDRPFECNPGQLEANFRSLQAAGYSTLSDIEGVLDDGLVKRILQMHDTDDIQASLVDGMVPSCWLLTASLALKDKKVLDTLDDPSALSAIMLARRIGAHDPTT